MKKYILKKGSVEHQFFIFQIIRYLNFFDDLAFVSKRDVMSLLRSNNGVYHDLILKGLIYEHQTDRRGTSSCQIIFKSSSIACYFLALKAIDDHNFDFVSCFAEWCGKQKYPKDVKAFVLNWLMMFYVESNEAIRNYLSRETVFDQLIDR